MSRIPIFILLLAAWAQAKDRAPYLVDATSTSAKVCWRSAGKDDCLGLGHLAPGAEFTYRAAGRTVKARTLPAGGRPLRFAVLGDSGRATIAQEKVASVLAGLAPDLILHVGDVVYPTGRDQDYDPKYFQIYAPTIAKVAVFPAVGNHDYGNAYKSARIAEKRFAEGYARVFRRPRYYAFDAGGVHFVSLDTNEAVRLVAAARVGPDSPQRRWLEEDLSSSRARWKIVFMHVPLYSTYRNHGDNAFLRASLQGLFEKHGVDLVLAGHDHLYQRSKRINGITYLTVGTGGAGVMGGPLDGGAWLEKEIVRHGLLSVRADDKRLSLQFLDADGAVLDSLDIDKP